jgi:NitT/TauT family transport system substrate-binding protein
MLKKLRLLAAAAVVSALALVGCSAPASTTGSADDATVTVRMGIQPWIGYAQWYVAEAKDLLSKEGIKLELIELKTDSEQSAAFASGRIDVDNIAAHTALLLKSQGIGLKIVMIEDASTTADAILAAEGVTSFDQLRGKKVAYEQGATSDLLLHAALQANDMTLDDIQAVPMPAADAGAALIAGRVDAAVTYEPYITASLKESGSITKIYDATEHPGLVSDVMVASDSFIAQHPDVVKKLVKVWGEAVAAYNADPAEGRTIISKAVGEDVDDLNTAFDGVRYYGLPENREEFETYTTQTLPMILQSAKDAGVITSDVTVSDAVDGSHLK